MTENTTKIKHCFLCGASLEKQSNNWFQCSHEDCGEMFLLISKNESVTSLIHVKTPFTKN